MFYVYFYFLFVVYVFFYVLFFFFFKQKTAYEMRISDWSSDVCSSDLLGLLVLIVRVILDREVLEALFAERLHAFRRPAHFHQQPVAILEDALDLSLHSVFRFVVPDDVNFLTVDVVGEVLEVGVEHRMNELAE